MLWCDALSVLVGMIDIAVVIAFIGCFVYLKITAGKAAGIERVTINPEGFGSDDVEMVDRRRSFVNPLHTNDNWTKQ